jgi:HK97 gp10 family phage protein
MAKIEGLDGVLKELRKLEGKQAKKLVRHSLRAGAKPLRNEMKRNAKTFDDPETGQAIYKQIATRTIPKRTLKRYGFEAGVSTGVKESGKDEPYHYAQYLERGTSKMAAQPFIRPAIDTTKDIVFTAVSKDLWSGIKNTITKSK